MAAKDVKLNKAALKLLSEYSEAEGISPSEAVLRLVPKPKTKSKGSARPKKSRSVLFKSLMEGGPSDLPDAEINRMAVEAVNRYRASKW